MVSLKLSARDLLSEMQAATESVGGEGRRVRSAICVGSESNEPREGQAQPQVSVSGAGSTVTKIGRLGWREKDGESPSGRGGKREKDRQGRRHLKAEATRALTPAPRSGKSGSGPRVFTFCGLGCLMKRANPFPACQYHHSSADTHLVPGPGAGVGTVGWGAVCGCASGRRYPRTGCPWLQPVFTSREDIVEN